ncbi:shikimate kinase [Bacillus sp. DNRA2]|uniref:shikimate kinase n=1 Tax=Bacillus sp. DNRA2 TaxID=2723053 RepID=UPI00145D8E99|nr:shikimate kinase [Bacillus sp. DNRA2]
MQAIYLIGLMGAGKTTVGKDLATALGVSVIDMDAEIVSQEGKSINDIFAENGEAYFRDLESTFIKTLPLENAIITTGGGIVMNEANRQWMKEHGFVVFLDANPAEILERLQNDQSRPLLKKDKETALFELYNQRLPLYLDCCHMKIDTTGKDIPTIVKEIIARF